jgi:hypothetical protein
MDFEGPMKESTAKYLKDLRERLELERLTWRAAMLGYRAVYRAGRRKLDKLKERPCKP